MRCCADFSRTASLWNHATAGFFPVVALTPSNPITCDLAGVRVLVVDDNPTNLRILENQLRRWNMEPVAANSASQALAALEAAGRNATNFQVILTDNRMPQTDGFDLVERIHRDSLAPSASVVLLTSAHHREDSKRCKELGIAAYLLKPVRQSELCQTLTLVLGGQPQVRPAAPSPGFPVRNADEPNPALSVLL
jgi:two-component system sensor histidine kinase/response regulator